MPVVVEFGRASELRALRVLATRGHVSVTLCEDRGSRRQVVAKHSPLRVPGDDPGDDVRQELEVARLLHRHGGHPHIVSYLSAVTQNGWLRLTMEHCAGGDLFRFVAAQPEQRLREPDALALWRQVVSAVAFLHGLGVAHRDVSLENVLLDDRLNAKLCDFGLSAFVSKRSARDAEGQVGKAYYMAPEVVRGDPYDACRADVWSLGILLFILLTGSPLVQVAAPSDRVFQALARGAQPSHVLKHWGLHRSLSAETMELLDALLCCDPRERPSSAAAVLAWLE
ncbi:hypothetical protein P43SY_008422 [Pythium insidiosum]|uniref:Protein kinase domain-containing protein n=1 Tax=Pythium insidiosum TaxID=114742 RepID=A0AAD5Q6L7_PYTIN|nr:hypothetical protein P43SY_008422 [Pythium insidiosum]